MSWLTELVGFVVSAIAGAFRSPAPPTQPPAPPVEAPGFEAIERTEDERLERLRESVDPVAVPPAPRPPSISATDRAEEADAMKADSRRDP